MYSAFRNQGAPGLTYNFWQLQASFTDRTGPLTVRGEVSYTPEASFAGGQTLKGEVGAAFAATDWLSFSGEYGYCEGWLQTDRAWWDAGLTMSSGQFDVDIRYYDTDLDFAECGYSDNCKPSLAAAITWHPWKG